MDQNVDSTSDQLKILIQSVLNDRGEGNVPWKLIVHHLASPSLLTLSYNTLETNLNSPADISLLNIYDSLIELWISSLPSGTPGVLRLQKEKIARQVAADVYLASIGVSVGPAASPSEISIDENEPGTLRLPVRSRKGKEKVTDVSKSSQIPMLPPSSQITSRPLSQSSVASGVPNPSSREDPASERLRAYTTLRPQPVLPTSMSTMLMHWMPGTDPNTYSWTATNRVLEVLTETEDDTGVEKARHQRRQDRLKRQRAAMLESTAAAEQSPTRLWGSQPPAVRVAKLLSSQATVEERIPMTQVERGPFGGREDERKRKAKRRAAGF
jgi:RNA polymerase I-specific transcription initiation factor RRN6